MDRVEKLTQQKKEILKQIAQLPAMRRGSVTEQYLDFTRKDGSKTKRGPYRVYSFKVKDKTVSSRLRNKQEEKLYRRQIEAFRRFQQLTAELARIGHELADLVVAEQAEEKKTSRH